VQARSKRPHRTEDGSPRDGRRQQRLCRCVFSGRARGSEGEKKTPGGWLPPGGCTLGAGSAWLFLVRWHACRAGLRFSRQTESSRRQASAQTNGPPGAQLGETGVGRQPHETAARTRRLPGSGCPSRVKTTSSGVPVESALDFLLLIGGDLWPTAGRFGSSGKRQFRVRVFSVFRGLAAPIAATIATDPPEEGMMGPLFCSPQQRFADRLLYSSLVKPGQRSSKSAGVTAGIRLSWQSHIFYSAE
jgi:hypothetical protein